MQRRLDAELLAHAVRVADLSCVLRSTCTTRSPRTHCAEILVRRPDADLLDARVRRRERARRRRAHRRPRARPSATPRRPSRRALPRADGTAPSSARLDALAGLVARPQVVAERLDDVIGGDADVRGALLDHLQHRVQHADHRAERPVLALVEAPQAVEVTEQLVRPVDEMDDHRTRKGVEADRRVALDLLDQRDFPVRDNRARASCSPTRGRRACTRRRRAWWWRARSPDSVAGLSTRRCRLRARGSAPRATAPALRARARCARTLSSDVRTSVCGIAELCACLGSRERTPHHAPGICA